VAETEGTAEQGPWVRVPDGAHYKGPGG